MRKSDLIELTEKGREIIINMVANDIIERFEIKDDISCIVLRTVQTTLDMQKCFNDAKETNDICLSTTMSHIYIEDIVKCVYDDVCGEDNPVKMIEWLHRPIRIFGDSWGIEKVVLYIISYVSLSDRLNYARDEFKKLTDKLLKLDTNDKD